MTADRLYSLPCGCDVLFTAASNYRTAVPTWCQHHDPAIQESERGKLIAWVEYRRDEDDKAAHKE